MNGKPYIFLSYRRDDSADVTGRIYDRLVQRFGETAIFRDIEAIPLGVDFRVHIDQVVGRCNVLLAIIGPNWVTIADTAGRRRLDDPDDFVRLEVEAALTRKILVIPLLMRGAGMPQESELPGRLKEIAYRNGIPIRQDPDFHHDLDRLIAGLEQQLPGVEKASPTLAPTIPPPARASEGPNFNLGGNIQAGQVNVGGTQTFRGPVEVDLRETQLHQPKGEVVTGDKIEMSGDFRGALVNIQSHLENAAQTIRNLPATDEAHKTELVTLIGELKSELVKLPKEKAQDAEKVASRVEALAREAGEEKPDEEMIAITGESLKRAARNLADVLPMVIPIATKIIAAALKLHGL
jgi:hypothetical protein